LRGRGELAVDRYRAEKRDTAEVGDERREQQFYRVILIAFMRGA
jgi:hypothetical protein